MSVQRPHRRLVLIVGWFLVSVLISAGCSRSPDDPAGSASPGLSHVHGLGVNPADGELYVASHHGVFRLVDGKAERMGGLIQDTMGFTIAGPDRFLGSGHPDIRNDTILKPGDRPLLGLIESRDQAVTWQGQSLQGEVDFHVLAFAHDRVYGFDSTSSRFMVSTDMKGWETRSQIGITSFAVSPDNPESILAAGEQGLVRSSDGGRSWASVASAPPLVFLSWDAQAGLWGLAQDGSVHLSEDAGARWTKRGQVSGQPGALLAHPTGLFVATSTAISESTDQGATWTKLADIT